MLRSYATLGRALAYARRLSHRWPHRTFVVVLSPLPEYAFRYLIKTGSAYVGR